jgi:hypothetical protein
MENLSSKIGIACWEFEEGSRGTKIFIFCSRKSPGRLEFQGHSDKIGWGSKFLIKESRVILFLRDDQEISRSFDFVNRLGRSKYFSFGRGISNFAALAHEFRGEYRDRCIISSFSTSPRQQASSWTYQRPSMPSESGIWVILIDAFGSIRDYSWLHWLFCLWFCIPPEISRVQFDRETQIPRSEMNGFFHYSHSSFVFLFS